MPYRPDDQRWIVGKAMFAASLVDPDLTRDHASIASLLLTTEALIVEKKEDKPAPAAPGGGMGGMY